jgi:nicotinamide-nucleotide amidase
MSAVRHDTTPLLFGLAIGFALTRIGGRLMTAESCTGGLVSHWVTAVPGTSAWFDGGVVTYANAAKVGFLQVSETTLTRWGAVSAETAAEMARGLQRQHRQCLGSSVQATADGLFAISVTGIAGPEGALPGKPIGTVFFGWATPQGVTTGRRVFAGGRGEIQRQAALWALSGLFARLSA